MNGGTVLQHIDALDALAKTLFAKVEHESSALSTEVAAAVQGLHVTLRHLRVEAAEPDSVLRSTNTSDCARQLESIVEDCNLALNQLQVALGKSDAESGREPDQIVAARSRLASETVRVNEFLDTIQLHHPAKGVPRVIPQGSQSNLEDIKDRVDNIAARLFRRWNINGAINKDEDSTWLDFRSELEKERFSPQILDQHKNVLRAYIRELRVMSSFNSGPPPPVRVLLEQEAMQRPPPPLPPKQPLSPRELCTPGVEKAPHFPSINQTRHVPDQAPVAAENGEENHCFSPDDASGEVGSSLALICTKDVINMDNLGADMALMHMQPSSSDLEAPGARSSTSLTLSGMSGSCQPPSLSIGQSNLSRSMNGSSSLGYVQPGFPFAPGAQPGIFSSSPGIVSRLGPDGYGRPIPMDATWTKIPRSLVSLRVLDRAGVRYEARPEYVAILGKLSREEVQDYATQSAHYRAAQSKKYPLVQSQDRHCQSDRSDPKSSCEDIDDGSVLWDESDATDHDDDKSTRDAKNYPYIVSPPNQDKTSPSSTVAPKPILKNKNENHVRFDPEPYEVDIKSPRSYDDDHYRRRENDSRRTRNRRHSGRREERARRDENRHRYPNRSEHGRRKDRRDERQTRRRTWGESIGVVGIGGAAASLLGVLTEAAVGF
ncbi:uncharacterized protein MAM_00209 [Metarhizium album ARSEF 1941]|uniref:DUF8035 domain-containing protein n=1 Tax=Metarhizium album (strain ARSEF 1941) TaxID=1081103 RepID=A0A0B2X619_METAS|nr:uncharacterized protein MAM_00209 [Metarhizium album ARSEF 1941]KHO01208.1 hypothetical protein MAM_00209 [Metarhizium album ARSEF 1941]